MEYSHFKNVLVTPQDYLKTSKVIKIYYICSLDFGINHWKPCITRLLHKRWANVYKRVM